VPEMNLQTCTVTRIVPFEENVRLFCLGSALPFRPGQFITLFDEQGKSCYFALASPPSRKECIELLVKKNSGVSDYLFQKKVGDTVSLKGPLGKGFPLDPFVGKNLLFIGVGTAIAPLRSTLITALERRSDFNRIALYFGTLTPNHVYFGEEMKEWHKKGAEIHITVTFPDETWDSHSGFVQDILSQSGDPLHETVAYVCGMKEMVEATTKVLKERMVPESLILQNF
jgi:sulfhydrogenase subunit gamma (sulfur reductase)